MKHTFRSIHFLLLTAAIFFTFHTHAQLITTIAGAGSGEGGDGKQVWFFAPGSLVANPAGDVYVSDRYRLMRIAQNGKATVVAGSVEPGATILNTPATAARFAGLGQATIDAAGNIYIVDAGNYCIRKISPDGIVRTISGISGQSVYAGDGGLATNAKFIDPEGIAIDTFGNLFIADRSSNRIRKITAATGIITTIAGNVNAGFSGDGGLATAATLNKPTFLATDRTGNLYIAEPLNRRMRKIDALTGIISTVVGNGSSSFSGDGGLATAAGAGVAGMAIDTANNIYFCDNGANRIRKVTAATGIITTIGGNGGYMLPNGDGGPAITATILSPTAISLDEAGNIYLLDQQANGVRKINSSGIISTIAGSGNLGSSQFAGDNNYSTVSRLFNAQSIAIDQSGNVFITDGGNHRIRKIAPNGIITVTAGTGDSGDTGDGGLATNAQIGTPASIATDGNGNYYFADLANYRIRKVDAAGIITTIAGNGTVGYSGDGGLATAAMIGNGIKLAADAAGNVYFADRDVHRVRKISASGIITTVAGTGTFGFSGDGGPAAAATLTSPAVVATDAAGNLFIADAGNSRIRKMDPGGIISTVVGNGMAFNSGDGGPAINAGLYTTSGINVDNAGNIYIAFFNNPVIRMVNAAGVISTITGGTISGYTGDGHPAINARIGNISMVATDTARNIYFIDNSYYVARVICAANQLAVNGSSLRWPTADTLSTTQFLTDRCQVIMGIKSSGNYPISTVTDFSMHLDPTVQSYNGIPYVQRHVDVEPLAFPSLYTNTFTLLYSQEDFDNYNIAAGSVYHHLPTGPNDVAGIAAIRITEYKGHGTAPGNYTGWTGSTPQTETFAPATNAVIWNSLDARWEISISASAFGGFYVNSEPGPNSVANPYTHNVGITIYPNPAHTVVSIHANDAAASRQEVKATITDIEGRILKTFIVINDQPVGIGELADGMYLLRLSSGQTFKLLKN